MLIGDIGPDVIAPILVFSIPILAIVGGITAGIVKTMSRHRIIELAQRERIAMIERGLDPSKLPPLPISEIAEDSPMLSPVEAARRRSQGLMIGGLVTLAVGLSLGVMLYYVADEPGVWSVGLIAAAIGVALLISAYLVRPRNGS
jgi:FtsH-binding integral membrane protein